VNAGQRTEMRAAWLRSMGWSRNAGGEWTSQVATTRGGRYVPMSLDHAFEVALKRCVIDEVFRVEIRDGRTRLASHWRELAQEDRDVA
jgi:hypothetical protein